MKQVWLILMAVMVMAVGGTLDAWAKKGGSGHGGKRDVRISDDDGHRHGGEDKSGHHGRRHGGEGDGDRHGRWHSGEDDSGHHGRRHGGEGLDDHGRHGRGEIEIHRSGSHQ